ncbi:MAG: hypothetical protein ACM3MA_01670 [Acidobacteriota bacterium]
MYFQSRAEAGVMLAADLTKYRYENTVVLALSDGAVQLGMQIAAEIHATLALMLSERIDVPGEGEFYGMVDQKGQLVPNTLLSEGQRDEYYSEYHGFFEEQKREQSSRLNKLLSSGGVVSESMLREQNVVLLSDGLKDPGMLEVAVNYMKPLKILRLIVATPVASVPAVDRAHVLADELHILSITNNFLDVNHYYEVNDTPSHEETIQMLNDFVLRWR